MRVFAAWALALAGALLASCASGPTACKRDPTTGFENCQATSSNVGEAVGTAAAATAAWVAVGCTVNGCEPPYRCNENSKLCERIRCDEGPGVCPPGYVCDPEKHVCL